MWLGVRGAENGAAHQGRPAQAGQDRAAEPLDGDAPAIDPDAGLAVDRQRRLVTEVDSRRIVARPVRAAPAHMVQVRRPLPARDSARTALPVPPPAREPGPPHATRHPRAATPYIRRR